MKPPGLVLERGLYSFQNRLFCVYDLYLGISWVRWVRHLDWLSESVEILVFGSVVFELEAKIRPCHHFQKSHTVGLLFELKPPGLLLEKGLLLERVRYESFKSDFI